MVVVCVQSFVNGPNFDILLFVLGVVFPILFFDICKQWWIVYYLIRTQFVKQRMLIDLFPSNPLLRIHHQTALYEVHHLTAFPFAEYDLVFLYLLQYLFHIASPKRESTLQQLIENHSNRPYIRFNAIGLAFNHFRRHCEITSQLCLGYLIQWSELFAKT